MIITGVQKKPAGAPLRWRVTTDFRRPLGTVTYTESEQPPLLVVEPRGAVGPAMLRDVLKRAEAFGRTHPRGWVYLADVRKVRFVSMRNLRYLAQLHHLPHLRAYLVLAPRWSAWLLRHSGPFKPTATFTTMEAARTEVARISSQEP